ncbi:MAG: hypothetical protein A2289_02710 [Deltaproteobacteria bacterium RIFOXYA12_FULL_58_15]|nr:MAG: hypothetical protein A2289_02710 [Deltaproteobacteria bacterium RIFOXYA12_FULL_58_15]OGR13453.1 MAG: hypothetical protein A2341_28010 [Deltaproteobacteria bacterium RIFOXYB12_FULL_58_9]
MLRTRSTVRVVIGDRNVKDFVVPRKAAQSVVELLRPYATPQSDSVSADEAFSDQYAKHGRAGTVLRGLRSRDELTQAKLAKKLGVTQGDVSAMENGHRSIGKSMARRLAEVFRADYRVFL